jgi:hypothetical protein
LTRMDSFHSVRYSYLFDQKGIFWNLAFVFYTFLKPFLVISLLNLNHLGIFLCWMLVTCLSHSCSPRDIA